MILPILAYGHGLLRQPCFNIDSHYPNLITLINNMWETMQHANGCGLAAPQIGQAIRIFIVDSQTTYKNMEASQREIYFAPTDQGIKETFINARLINSSDNLWADEEGCLSIPGVSGKVKRPWTITLEYFNENFEKQTRTFSGATARMIQHEYDHTNGILYLDYLSPLTRKLMEAKLKKIAKGQIQASYPMKYS